MNWTYGCGGGGAIDLVMHLHHLRFQEAVQWLRLQFPGALWPEATLPSQKPALAIPPPDPSKLWRVRRYLVQERRLPSALVDSLIQSGHLYADGRANAVFLLLGKENNPVGAELRGTTLRPWHGMAPGSQKDLGYFAIPIAPLPATILVESAIDAISCFFENGSPPLFNAPCVRSVQLKGRRLGLHILTEVSLSRLVGRKTANSDHVK